MNIFKTFLYLFTDHNPDQHLKDSCVIFCMFCHKVTSEALLWKLTSFFLDISTQHCFKNVRNIVTVWYQRKPVTPISSVCVCVCVCVFVYVCLCVCVCVCV